MKTRAWLWIGTLLALPAWVAAAEPAKPTFDLRAESVQGILRATVAASEASEAQTPRTESKVKAELAEVRFRAPKRVHHTKCDSEDCVAYSADNEPLFSMSRDLSAGLDGMSAKQLDDAWLSCQDTNNLLSTFERFDRCRGIRIGTTPYSVGDVQLKLPMNRL